jgi:hypothetical protein
LEKEKAELEKAEIAQPQKEWEECKSLFREVIQTKVEVIAAQNVHIDDLNSRHRDFIAGLCVTGCSSGMASGPARME